MKRFYKFVFRCLLGFIVGFVITSVACSYDEQAPANVEPLSSYSVISHQLYNYDKENKVRGDKYNSINLVCKERYVLEFDFEVTKSLSALSGSKVAKINVKLGDYENDDNKAHLVSTEQELGGGPQFSFKNEGEWESSMLIDRTTTSINLKRSYFIIGIDTLSRGGIATGDQPVKISISVDGYKPIEYRVTLVPTKAYHKFSESNLVTEIGASAVKNNLTVNLPISAEILKVEFWKDSNKQERYGAVEYSATNNVSVFTEGFVKFVLSDNMIYYVGQTKYDEEISENGQFDVYITFTIAGSTNYMETTIGKNFSLL